MQHSHLAKRGLTIGYVAERTGLPTSAIRYYEDEGLVTPDRNDSGHRRYARADIRRLSFVMISQGLGFSVDLKPTNTSLVGYRARRFPPCQSTEPPTKATGRGSRAGSGRCWTTGSNRCRPSGRDSMAVSAAAACR